MHFRVTPIKFETIEELPNGWENRNYRELLELMDYGDTSGIGEEDLKEMCHMSLSDFEPEEAAKIVLAYVFEGRLKTGQINNLANEMLEEKMWEEYADLSLHEEFFNVSQLLYEAFGGQFPHPQAVLYQMKINPKEKAGLAVFGKNTEASVLRILVQGMPENTLILRLFEDPLREGEFREAQDIIWQLKAQPTEDSLHLELISSRYWFHDLKYASDFEASLVYPEEET